MGLGIKRKAEEREVPGYQTIFLTSEDMERDFKKMKKTSVEVRKEITEESWGSEFSILDPDKNKIVFIQRK